MKLRSISLTERPPLRRHHRLPRRARRRPQPRRRPERGRQVDLLRGAPGALLRARPLRRRRGPRRCAPTPAARPRSRRRSSSAAPATASPSAGCRAPSPASPSCPSGRVLAQDDEAERWIAAPDRRGRPGRAALGPPGHARARARGPQPVREGRAGPAAEDPPRPAVLGRERARGDHRRPAARRDRRPLRGGRSAKIATATGKPKAGGPWGVAVHEAAALRADLARLDAPVRRARRGARRTRRGAGGAGRRRRPRRRPRPRRRLWPTAERAAEAARVHRSRLDAARDAQRAAALEQAAAAAGARRATTGSPAAAPRRRRTPPPPAHACAGGRRRPRRGRRPGSRRRPTPPSAARAAHAAARQALDAAERAARANAAAARAAALGERLARATALAARDRGRHRRGRGPPRSSDADVRAAREAAADLDRARARMEAGAVTRRRRLPARRLRPRSPSTAGRSSPARRSPAPGRRRSTCPASAA